MKLVMLTHYNARDQHFWSGIPAWLAKSLQDCGVEVEFIGPIKTKWALWSRFKCHYYRLIKKKIYLVNRDALVIRDRCQRADKVLCRLKNVDAVLAPYPIDIAFLKTDLPIITFHDATWGDLIDFYPLYESNRLSKATMRDGDLLEKTALKRCSLAIYTSEWAAQSAVRNYGCDPKKIQVIPLGANLVCNRTAAEVEKNINDRSFDVCKLLWLGVHWERKGGAFAIKVAQIMNEAGIRTTLTMAGANPPLGTDLPDYVQSLGFISKNDPQGQIKIDSLFMDSHFFILPTNADCTPIVFCEACSFGVPSITNNVGGVATIVHDGINGKVFNLTDQPETYATYLMQLISDRSAYTALAKSAFHEFETRLNWKVAAPKIADEISKIINQ